MRQTEYHNNTPDQVIDYLQNAANIVGGIDIPPDLTEIAFSKAVDLLSGKQIVLEQVGVAMPMPGPNQH